MAKQQSSWFGYLYLLQCGEHYKIGFSQTPRKRLRQLRTGSPHPIIVVHELRTAFYRQIEKKLHYKFADKRGRGEWFKLEPEDVQHIKSLNSSGFTPEQERKREKDNDRYYAGRQVEKDAERNRQLAVLLSGAASGAGDLCWIG